MLFRSDTKLPDNMGNDFGQWRVKEEMNQLEIRAPQFYRYTKMDEPNRWYYVASGQSPDQAKWTFDNNKEYTRISFLSSGDVCVPFFNAQDLEGRQKIMDELERVAS